MSRLHQELTIKGWFQYMEELATRHVLIGHSTTERHYTRGIFQAIQEQFKGLKSPALLVEAPESEGIDKRSDNLLVQRYVAFTVAKKIPTGKAGDHATALDLELDCETIALQLLARMKRDQLHYADQKFARVELDAWQGESASALLPPGSWVGYRIMVPVMNVDRRLAHDSGNWSDDTSPPALNDATQLSCANLRHPTLGLTREQRDGCLLPTYDFGDPLTQGALTEEQIEALRAYLGVEDSGSGSGGACPVTVRIWYQGEVKATVPDLDPCVDNEIIITCEELT